MAASDVRVGSRGGTVGIRSEAGADCEVITCRVVCDQRLGGSLAGPGDVSFETVSDR